MTYQTLDNITSNGSINDLVNVLTFPTRDFPIFYPFLIFAFFIIFTLSLFFTQTRKEGRSNLLSATAVSSFVTAMIALPMKLLGLIGSKTLVFVFGVSIVFIVLYLLTKKD